MKISFLKLFIFFLLPGLLLLSSCNDENLKPGVPAFVHVDPFSFSCNYATEGSSRQKIKDVWVFANGATVGVFELPATIPVLLDGTFELRLEPGIELNGISTTRVSNPFFEPIVIDEFDFIPDSMVSTSPSSTYWESTEFVWIEAFEIAAISLDTTNLGGTTDIYRVEGDEAYEGTYSGKFSLDSEHTVFEAATFESYVLPVNGQPVLLEMDYKNDYFFSVGIIEQTSSQIIKTEIIVLNPSDDWNKIYINLTDKVKASSATSFKILIRSYIGGDVTEANVSLDNLKLMYR